MYIGLTDLTHVSFPGWLCNCTRPIPLHVEASKDLRGVTNRETIKVAYLKTHFAADPGHVRMCMRMYVCEFVQVLPDHRHKTSDLFHCNKT